MRDGIYGGILAGHAGAGEYWFWDRVDRSGLAPDYLAARKVIDDTGLLTHFGAKPMAVWAETPTRGSLNLAAGGGWEKSATTELDLPNVGLAALKGWSPYFQSLDGGQKAWAKPLIVKFTAREAGKLQLAVGQTSSKGGMLTVWVNDNQVFEQKYGAPGERSSNTPIVRRPGLSIDYPTGPVVVRLENHGADWVRVDSMTVPDQGATAVVHGLGQRDWALIRVVGSDTSKVTVHGLSLADGTYRAMVIDAATGESSRDRIMRVRGGVLNADNLPLDSVIDLQPARTTG